MIIDSHILNVTFNDPWIKQWFVNHAFVKLRHIDDNVFYVLVGSTFRANSVHEILRLQISVYTTTHITVGVYIGAGCASLTSCRAALRIVSERDFFVVAIFAESKVRVSAVTITKRLKFIFMSCRGKIYFAANIALCATQACLIATTVFFFYNVAASVFFNFSASTLKHVMSTVNIIRRSCKIMFCIWIIQVATCFALCVAA